MKKYLSLLAAIFFFSSVQPVSASYLYTFSSGDILDPNTADAYYGLGRIDFDLLGIPYPTVIESGDSREPSIGDFTMNGTKYIYVAKSKKHDASTTHLGTWYSFYNPSVSVSEPLNSEERFLSLPYNPVASPDILLTPDEANGLIYAIDGNTLRAINPLTWTDQATASLSSEYQVHQVVSLWPDTHNYLYVWSSKRTNITASGDYTPVSSDIHVYDRESLEEVAVFHHVRTGFDTTIKKSDDEPEAETGRGLVFIRDKLIAYVAYDSAEAVNAHASIWCIDESGLVPESTRTTTSKDIEGFDIDIESPMPDALGGFYFVAESGDLNASLSSTDILARVYHYSSEGKLEYSPSINVMSNAELVMKQEGRYKGSIFMYSIIGEQWSRRASKKMEVFLWNGGNENGIKWRLADGTYGNQANMQLYEEGVEIEKPFTAGTGFYYSMESVNQSIRDEKDAIYYWDGEMGSRSRLVWSSEYELEVEEPPLEKVQNEFALVEIPEHNQLFAGAGPVGGKFRLTVLDWTQKAALESGDNVIITYDNEDMGGNANVGGMIQFTEARRVSGGSSGGCEMGFGLWAIGIIGAVIFSRRKSI